MLPGPGGGLQGYGGHDPYRPHLPTLGRPVPPQPHLHTSGLPLQGPERELLPEPRRTEVPMVLHHGPQGAHHVLHQHPTVWSPEQPGGRGLLRGLGRGLPGTAVQDQVQPALHHVEGAQLQ
ncbi:hypothetical protein CRUP_009156 [Coryphaenoides rupestris]|nr:hypothetical protein CRUP_009156 [Coryphaenoides rupestris]